MAIQIIERDISKEELDRMNAGFIENDFEHGVTPYSQTRYGYVVMEGDRFLGCISGLANSDNWFYITDLWLEKECRHQGLGSMLIEKLENKLRAFGFQYVYTWTAGYEAPPFYKKKGYEVFCEQENFYSTGDSRIGFRKTL